MTAAPQMGLTPRAVEVLAFLRRYIAEHSSPPSLNEIAQHLKMGSKSSVHRLLKQIEARGYIVWMPNKARSIALLEPRDALLDALPPKLRARLVAHCKEHGDTPAAVIIDAVSFHVDAFDEVPESDAEARQ
jgi:repressor LexA